MEVAARRGWQVVGPAIPNNLPAYLTSFVGRGSEVRALKRLLPRSRMLTLTGPGGGGKSRLAAELVRTCFDNWPGMVWWVGLAPVREPHQVAGAVVSALELPGQAPAQDVVIAWLAARRALLVLDNCEHVLAASANFCQAALECCPELTIIATSRAALGIAGEACWPVSSLRVPDAVQLFVARASLVQPGFKAAASNLNAVTEICERVDRLPLAIELAAARIAMMTEKEILSQLSDRFHLLTSGSRTSPERHRTLNATIDWSYRLLTQEEAMLFQRLSVFRGGFTLESAQKVCADGFLGTVLDSLSGLVHKSMVVAERTEDSGSRYRLLESQLAYAEDRLHEEGQLELIRRRHYEYFKIGLSSRTTSYMGSKARRPGFDDSRWIAHESGNLWAAMEWARINADDLGLGFATNLAITRLGDLAQLRSLIQELLSSSPAKGKVRLHALGAAFNVAYRQGDHEAAVVYAEAGVAVARDLGDIEELAQALHFAGIARMSLGEFAEADEMLAEAELLLRDSHNHRLVNFIRTAIAYRLVQKGDCAAARDILADCLITARADGDVSRTAYHLDALAWALLGLNEPRAAAASWNEALSIQRGLRKQLGIIDCLIGISCVAEACNDDRRAERLAAAAIRVSSELSYRPDHWMSGQLECSRRRSRDRLGVRVSEEAWKQGLSMSLDRAAEYALGESQPETVIDASLLSRRELEVATLVAAGMTNRQIGEHLFISGRTAGGHVERIRNKLGVRSRTEVATWVVGREQKADHVVDEPSSLT